MTSWSKTQQITIYKFMDELLCVSHAKIICSDYSILYYERVQYSQIFIQCLSMS